MTTLTEQQLRAITGGSGYTAPVKPIQYPDMGAPKYSAAWWDIVRARGLDK